MFDIANFMHQLSIERPIFHSEADFQHAFAWQLHELLPHAKIRLEYPFELDKRAYLDIWAETNTFNVAIELKYKTVLQKSTHNGETFQLKNQSAQDTGRYDFIKDILRLEKITSSRPETIGYAIMLTNDKSYWSSTDRQTVDADFRLHDHRTLSGTLRWSEKASSGTTKGRSEALVLTNKYPIEWQSYSALSEPNGEFRYLVNEVNSA